MKSCPKPSPIPLNERNLGNGDKISAEKSCPKLLKTHCSSTFNPFVSPLITCDSNARTNNMQATQMRRRQYPEQEQAPPAPPGIY